MRCVIAVGYQNKGFDHAKFSYVCNTFNDVANGRTRTLGELDASDDFYDSSIQFLTSGGATAKVTDPNLGTVYATYKFWWAEDAAAGVRGWYFEADQDGEYPQNDRVIKAGEGFCVNLSAEELTATITIPTAPKMASHKRKTPHRSTGSFLYRGETLARHELPYEITHDGDGARGPRRRGGAADQRSAPGRCCRPSSQIP